MPARPHRLRPPLVALAVVGTLVALAACSPATSDDAAPTASAPTTSAPETTTAAPVEPEEPTAQELRGISADFDMEKHSIDDPDSAWVVVNKRRPIADGEEYVPDDLVSTRDLNAWGTPLRRGAEQALHEMFAAAADEADLSLKIQSAYRSYDDQVSAFQGYVDTRGYDWAVMNSAKPGYSEHQLGLAVDLVGANGECMLVECFEDTPEGTWLRENAWRFGWILRDAKGKTDITGWAYEPWHYRYVGTSLSTEMHVSGIETLEEFFGLDPAPDYPDED